MDQGCTCKKTCLPLVSCQQLSLPIFYKDSTVLYGFMWSYRSQQLNEGKSVKGVWVRTSQYLDRNVEEGEDGGIFVTFSAMRKEPKQRLLSITSHLTSSTPPTQPSLDFVSSQI